MSSSPSFVPGVVLQGALPIKISLDLRVSRQRGSPERSGRFLGEIRASLQHDLQRAKRAHIMAVELRVLLNAAKQQAEINLAGAREQMFFVTPVTVGEPDFFAAG